MRDNTMGKIFEMSEKGKSEYCLTVVKIGELIPIKKSDFLAQTFIGDSSLVVRKDQVKEGDLMYYATNECQLNERFLKVNNLFAFECHEKNENADEVDSLIAKYESLEKKAKGYEDENKEVIQFLSKSLREKAKSKCGFFNKNGRVRMVKLRNTPSMGFLFTSTEMEKYCPKTKFINMEDYLNVQFDTVDDELFVKVYVPPINPSREKSSKNKLGKLNKRIKRFDRMIDGEFSFHYDTGKLGDNMWRFDPNDVVTISTKLHGTSFIGGNIKIKNPIPNFPFYKRWWNKVMDCCSLTERFRITDYYIDYGNIYSSRKVILNQYINKNQPEGYYKFNIYNEVNNILKPYYEKGMIIYGEICGYANIVPIQKEYDYGCNEGEFFIMPYRITTKIEDKNGTHLYEWNPMEVKEWTERLIDKHPELSDKVLPLTVLYHGKFGDLYPSISTTEHWNENVLQKLMNDKERFGMEELEPMCKNKVPREGIVIRIDNDPLAEAFKLKCKRYLFDEGKRIDKGEVDMEMQEEFCDNEE